MRLTITSTISLLFVGLTFGAPSVKIINGDDVLDNSYPYQVSIQTGLFANEHQCAGTIISPSWVVTSAHCVGISLLVSRVVAGTFNLSDIDNNPNVQIRKIDLYNVIKHPDYNDISNDVALLKMTQPFEFNDYVKPLQISKVRCIAEDEMTVFTGWGAKNDQNHFNSVLQAANMSVIPFEDCFRSFNNVYGDNIVIKKEMHFCITGKAAPCYLDAGGPLVQDGRLIGLLTWIPAMCSDNSVPAIFTSTGYFKNFIKSYVTDLY
ncbi:trypsin-7 [Tribolium castaneum]|uniref:Serine protease H65 n=1 Tax=Tribolium castaneum TaxID=7070 RepID=D6WVI9_TRICA|nr:PREDICTED: trypsin-7 [Tribolium castaneum]EFA09201.1 serine protease H65 [Tribolium castaneum]|eukprot:XP_972136.1 PREDICTED: trypsin-7 [Tribolium castaneum]